MISGFARRPRLADAARTPPSGVRVDLIELAFHHRRVAQSELYRNIVQPALGETAIEVPHPRNDHARDRHADVRARLVEHEEVEAGFAGPIHARSEEHTSELQS